jgi:GT2 family glycosyltransferase
MSVIIPNWNGADTIEKCLESVYASKGVDFEAVVVDDCSRDRSVERISKFPCKLVRFPRHLGAGAARNAGAGESEGDFLFFTDCDCVLKEDTLKKALDSISSNGRHSIIGGIYSAQPYDKGFFSRFQSAFVNHFERKRKNPDYIATHALAIRAENFRASGGFPEEFLPILEDVAYSHQMRRAGFTLSTNSAIEVSHIFNYGFIRSLKNAYRKTKYWIMYSLGNRDLLADSGTASFEIKFNGLAFMIMLLAGLLSIKYPGLILPALGAFLINVFFSRKLLSDFKKAGGTGFALLSSLYYFFLYPLPVIAGGIAGLISYFRSSK